MFLHKLQEAPKNSAFSVLCLCEFKNDSRHLTSFRDYKRKSYDHDDGFASQ